MLSLSRLPLKRAFAIARFTPRIVTPAPIRYGLRSFTAEASGKEENKKSGGGNGTWIAAALAAAAAGGYYYTTQKEKDPIIPAAVIRPLDYQVVYNRIAQILDNVDYDDGSFGPLLVRLAWHASGTFDKASGTGGSNGATMRFGPESADGANAGLQIARDLLEPIKKEFPELSYADLWTLAGVVAIQEMGGPTVPWRPGRTDAFSAVACPPQGRLPDASKDQSHVRNVFTRMGFSDQEIVALVGAHALGRCHTDRSGFDGPWTFSPTTFTNDYFKKLLSERWVEKKWKGPKQYVDAATGSLMMLPSDIVMIKDRTFKKWVVEYSKDEAKFFDDFASAFSKLLELGVPFKEETPVYKFKAAA